MNGFLRVEGSDGARRTAFDSFFRLLRKTFLKDNAFSVFVQTDVQTDVHPFCKNNACSMCVQIDEQKDVHTFRKNITFS